MDSSFFFPPFVHLVTLVEVIWEAAARYGCGSKQQFQPVLKGLRLVGTGG